MTIEDHSSVVNGGQNGIGHPTAFPQKSNLDPITAKAESPSNLNDQSNDINDNSKMNNDGEDIIMQSTKEISNQVNGPGEHTVNVKQEHSGSVDAPISDSNDQSSSFYNKFVMLPHNNAPNGATSAGENNSMSDPILHSSSSSHQSPPIGTPQKRSNRSTSSQAADIINTNNNNSTRGSGSANTSPNSKSIINGTSPKRIKRPEPILSRNFAPLPQETPAPSQVEAANNNGSKRLERKSKVSFVYLK